MSSPKPSPDNSVSPARAKWEVTYLLAQANPFDTAEMAQLLNDGWEFMGIQSGSQGCDSFAYFRRRVS